MANKPRRNFSSLEKDNAEILAELIVDPATPDRLRVEILNRLLDQTDADNFFETITQEMLSYGFCPECGHFNHWLVPEEELNKLGWVSHEKDGNVKRVTTAEDCPKFQEACSKKRVNI